MPRCSARSSTAPSSSSAPGWPSASTCVAPSTRSRQVNGSLLGLILNRVKAKELGAGYGTYEYDYRPESERQRAKDRPGRGRRRPAVSADEVGPVNPTSVGRRQPDEPPEPGPHAHESSAASRRHARSAHRCPSSTNGTKPGFPADDSIFH